jgi:hypothetical protein
VWNKYLADFVRDALAAAAGAGFGAWLAFRFSRAQTNADHARATQAAAEALAAKRTTAGNLAIFALSQMHNDLLAYKAQMLDPATKTDAPWFWMPPVTVSPAGYYRISVETLAFMFQSRQPEAPTLPIKLSLEESRFAVLLEAIQHRAKFHQETVTPAIAKLQAFMAASGKGKLSPQELRAQLGEFIFATLRNYYSDIATLIPLGLESTKRAAQELRDFLIAELPGQTIISFEIAERLVPGGSPTMRARNELAEKTEQPRLPSDTG